MVVKTLAAIIINFEGGHRVDYEETVNALQGIGSYSFAPKKIDIDLKNRESPPAKLTIGEPQIVELNPLPTHMKYAFLGPNNTLPVIVSAKQTKP